MAITDLATLSLADLKITREIDWAKMFPLTKIGRAHV